MERKRGVPNLQQTINCIKKSLNYSNDLRVLHVRFLERFRFITSENQKRNLKTIDLPEALIQEKKSIMNRIILTVLSARDGRFQKKKTE